MSARETRARTKVGNIKTEIDRLSKKIARRIKRLEKQTGGEHVVEYRHDRSISKAINAIRDLYREGEEICLRYHLSEDACKTFREEPQVIKQLELSEEELIPLVADRETGAPQKPTRKERDE